MVLVKAKKKEIIGYTITISKVAQYSHIIYKYTKKYYSNITCFCLVNYHEKQIYKYNEDTT